MVYFILIKLIITKFWYLYHFFFFKKISINKLYFKKLKIEFSFNQKNNLIKPLCFNNLFRFTIDSRFNNLIKLIYIVFGFNKNIIFIDFDFNFNYLPLSNKMLFSRSSIFFNKTLKYFNVSVVFFLNLNKKKFIFKKLFSKKVINVCLNKKMISNKLDLNLPISYGYLFNYILYISVLQIYMFVKNKNLKTNGSTLFFFKYTFIYCKYFIFWYIFILFNLFFYLY